MSRIAIFDPYTGKFSDMFAERWRQQGHEVTRETFYNPDLVRWADIVWFETCDNSLGVATKGTPPSGYNESWDMRKMDLKGKKIIVRAIDIEVWYGHHKNVNWEVVTDVIFIADHIRKLLLSDVDLPSKGVRVHTIQCGVDMDKYPMSHNIVPTKIAWVARQWRSKGTDYALQILAKLPEEYKIYSLGEFGDYEWEKKYMENFLEKRRLQDRWIQETHVPDISAWYEDKGVLLSCSHKEGFGYTIGEGMARGLKPVVHRFYGAEDIWRPYIWDTIDEAVEQITTVPKHREQYRQYLIDQGYTLENMINRIEREVING